VSFLIFLMISSFRMGSARSRLIRYVLLQGFDAGVLDVHEVSGNSAVPMGDVGNLFPTFLHSRAHPEDLSHLMSGRTFSNRSACLNAMALSS
jgi:hypothetical protein